jgi:hypothetical protein
LLSVATNNVLAQSDNCSSCIGGECSGFFMSQTRPHALLDYLLNMKPQLLVKPASARALLGTMHRPDRTAVKIDGLWALMFGNGATMGQPTPLLFTAGPNHESDGLFGKIEVGP